MKTVYILNTYPIGSGIGEYVRDLSNLRNNIKIKNILFKSAYDRNLFFLGEVYKGTKFNISERLEWALNAYGQRFFYKDLRNGLMNLLGCQKYGLFHYSDPSILPFTSLDRSIVTIHDVIAYSSGINDGGPLNVRFRFIMKNLKKYKKFRHVITISHKVKTELENMGWDSAIHVIHYPISDIFHQIEEKTMLRKELGLPTDKILVLSVSTLTARKNLRVVNESIQRLGDNYKLVRVGPKIGDSITFERVNDRSHLNRIYNACDALLFPTLDEGFGRPVVEAFLSGLPVVATDNEIMNEIGGNNALLVEPTIESCVQGVREILSNKESFIERGLKRGKDFSFDKFQLKMSRIYDSI